MAGRRPSRPATARQLDVLAAYVESGGSIPDAADLVGIRPSTAKRPWGSKTRIRDCPHPRMRRCCSSSA